MNRLGIEFLSVFGMPPVELVELAADLGCAHISMGLSRFPLDPYGHRPWSLRDDPGLRRDLTAALSDRGVTISLGEGFAVRQGVDVRDFARDIELMCELGLKRFNTVALDPNLDRCLEQFSRFVEMIGAIKGQATLEFAPGLTIADLPAALAAIETVGQPHFRLLIDTMHLIRSGSSAEDLAALDPRLIGYVQLSDAPLVPNIADYMQEATFARMVPGTGELPLRDILAMLPRDVIVSQEVPQRAQAEAGVSARAWVGQCVAGARDLLP